VEPLKGLSLHRSSASTGLVHGLSRPAFCVVAQGWLQAIFCDRRLAAYECRHQVHNIRLSTTAMATIAMRNDVSFDSDPTSTAG
jgi:hypothetical protein